MTKDPSKISNLLNFLSKMLVKIGDKRKREERNKIREIFGEMLGIGSKKKDQDKIFYLVKCPELDGKSLLWYINSQNVRLFRQREELIDLSVKIANLTHEGDSEKAMNEVINNYKSGLPRGVGLRDMMKNAANMIEERYPWSTSKMFIMILVSLLACLKDIGLFVFDLATDIQFSLGMLGRYENFSLEDPTYDSVFKNSSHFFPEKCRVKSWETLKSCWNDYNNTFSEPEINIEYNDDMIMITTGWFSLWHCIQPFLGIFIVFFSMNYKKMNGCAEIPKGPIPVFNNIYMFYLNMRGHIARSKPQFKKEVETFESEILKYEASGKPCFLN